MNYTQIIEIPKKKVEELQKFLDSNGEGTMNTVETFTAQFAHTESNGSVEIDIKVCDGANPFVDPVMFQDGSEVGCLECDDTLLGEYVFSQFLKDTFTVFVKEI